MERESLCNSCKHEKMCKFKTDFTTAEKEVYENEKEINKKLQEDELIKVQINCKFYSSSKTIDIIAPSPLNPPYTFKRGSGCETCD